MDLGLNVTQTLVAHGWLDAQYHNLPLIVNWWQWMTTTFSEFQLMSWVFWVLIVVTFFAGGALFALIDYLELFRDYKIQYDRVPSAPHYVKCLGNLLFNYTVVIFPLSFGNLYLLHWFGIRPDMRSLPSAATMAWQLLLFFFVEDVFQYFLHRWLHTPWAYKHIHKVHHHFIAPFGLAGAYAHWAEVLILALPTYSGPMFVGPHLATMYLWIVIRELDTVHTHCGYEFPLQRLVNQALPFYGGTPFHDYHHYAFDVNFASRWTWLDRLFNTYEELPAHAPGDQADAKSGWHRSLRNRFDESKQSGAVLHGSSQTAAWSATQSIVGDDADVQPGPADLVAAAANGKSTNGKAAPVRRAKSPKKRRA